MTDQVREPAVAGTFYPASARELGQLVDRLLAAAAAPTRAPCPKALIVPHAGYVYSGPIAATAFARLAPFAERITRVVLVGPAHRVFVNGLVTPGARRLRTPLGEVELDVDALRLVGDIVSHPAAHAREHSIEVELPFLQRVVPRAKIVPLAGTQAEPEFVGRTLDALWGGPETVIVISSDLSHYLPYDDARERDARTAARIVALDSTLAGDDACGAIGINGLAWLARARKLSVELLDLRNSGDTSGRTHEVVGYGAFALYEGAA